MERSGNRIERSAILPYLQVGVRMWQVVDAVFCGI